MCLPERSPWIVRLPKADDGTREYQFFVGNKDIYGFMYKFVPQADLVESDRTKLTQPKDIMVAERLEYGNAIFYPVSMQLGTNEVLRAETPDFTTKLYALVEECNERRAKYTALKKTSAASIRIRKIDIQIKALTADKTTKEVQADAALTAQIDAKEKEKEKWNAEYEILAKQAEEMREAQEKDSRPTGW